jgi:hypothetical protein
VRGELIGNNRDARVHRFRGHEGGLAPRASAQIEPSLVRTNGSPSRQQQSGELRALILYSHIPTADGFDGVRIAPDQCERSWGVQALPRLGYIFGPNQTRERDKGGSVICDEEVNDFVRTVFVCEGSF